MKKKVGIITLNGNFNYGNKLQNYALINFIGKKNCKTIWLIKNKKNFIKEFIIANFLFFIKKYKRNCNFYNFNRKYISPYYCTSYKKITKKFNKFIVGSDQVWNHNFEGFDSTMYLDFSTNKNNNISYAASFGLDEIEEKYVDKVRKGINNIKFLSVRENNAKKIIKKITNRNDTIVLMDPTMLLEREDWKKIMKKPKKMTEKKFILLYFLGEISEERLFEIEKIAKKNNYEIINLLDKKSKYYNCGPSEFLYLEEHAELICTDSFHASVFGIIFDTSFVVFDRIENGKSKMGSRIETLISNFKLENRKYNGKEITIKNLEHNYSEAYEIIDSEREKSRNFIISAIE